MQQIAFDQPAPLSRRPRCHARSRQSESLRGWAVAWRRGGGGRVSWDNARVLRTLSAAAAVLVIAATAAAVQFDAPGRPQRTDTAYDGQFTFVRLRWQSDMGFSRRGFSSAWNHDYPRAEQNLSRILQSLTVMKIRTDASLILTLDDPALFKYPIAYMWEPGFWNLSDREAASFRAYLAKGGFAAFEDFDGAAQWSHFEAQMRRVLPEGRFVKLDKSHRIFDSFFQIKDIDAIVHPMTGIHPSYYGIFEDNDPAKRLMVVANYDNDVPESGMVGADSSLRRVQRGLQVGVNYVVYGFTQISEGLRPGFDTPLSRAASPARSVRVATRCRRLRC